LRNESKAGIHSDKTDEAITSQEHDGIPAGVPGRQLSNIEALREYLTPVLLSSSTLPGLIIPITSDPSYL